ncbi:hypothetical protein [Petroclostridium xylanilyticum]|uniref:hypothetical protein n=1 Tax=Petroclostridium xylanilyticum TaxID=1792311 RepID=UPI0012FFCB57|nr:hypothetical protein [Petroclostridium xylanilyticum]
MMTDRELLELIAVQVSKVTSDLDELKRGQGNLEEGQRKLEEGQRKLEEGQRKLEEGQRKLEEGQRKLEEGQRKLEERQKKLEMIMEQEIKPKIEALFDGWKQNSEQLERIEKEVSRHEEIILRRIK